MESGNNFDLFSLYGEKNDKITDYLNKKTVKDLDDSDFQNDILEHILSCLTSKTHRLPSFGKDFQWLNTTRSLSSEDDLEKKVYVLDFFTYCCINCVHILPYLKEVELKYAHNPGFAVIGVHSAKFINEQDLKQVKEAVLRNNIKHPVLNDPCCALWKTFGVYCWPTVFIVGPDNILLFVLVGETQIEKLSILCHHILSYFESNSFELDSQPLPISEIQEPEVNDTDLLFPGGISTNEEEIIVTDTGHNRLLLMSRFFELKEIIGSGAIGCDDGPFNTASFNSPHGTAWYQGYVYVADTANHSIRKIDFKEKTVSTVFNKREVHGLNFMNMSLPSHGTFNSPWDVCVGPQIGSETGQNILYIAVAGSHQIWTLDLESNTENPFFCYPFAGSGKEENRQNNSKFRAGFAQPSGIAYSDLLKDKLFIADSESSTIKSIILTGGAVKTIVGGGLDPTDLFQFGDNDGIYRDAKLQHPMGVCVLDKNTLLIADTYNHKIKVIDVEKRSCKTALINVALNEPSSICTLDDRLILIADTNNHRIVTISKEDAISEVDAIPETFDCYINSCNVFYSEEPKTVLLLSSDGKIFCYFKIFSSLTYTLNESGHQKLDISIKGNNKLEAIHRSKNEVFGQHQPALIIKSVPGSSSSCNEHHSSVVSLTVTMTMCNKRLETCSYQKAHFRFKVVRVESGLKDCSHRTISLCLELADDLKLCE